MGAKGDFKEKFVMKVKGLVFLPGEFCLFDSEGKQQALQLSSGMFRASMEHLLLESFVVQWCNRLTLQPEQSGGVGSIPGRTPDT